MYAKLSVHNMIIGKQISRATEAHTLLYAMMFGHLVATMYDSNWHDRSENDTLILNDSVDGLAKLARDIQDKTRNEDFLNDPLIISVRDKYTQFIEDNQTSKTIMLLLQYMKMVEIALSFLKAEGTGDWQLYLDMCRQILPYFASSGYYPYFKSGYLYLQTMYQLPIPTYPNLYEWPPCYM